MRKASETSWRTSLVLLLLSCIGGCPSNGHSVETLPACNPMNGHADCHGDFKFCIPWGDGASSGRCVACRTAADCDDGDSCNGRETCDGFLGCMAGTPFVCFACSHCVSPGNVCVMDDLRLHDHDGDGHASAETCGDDCDDDDADRFPGNTETCDAQDHDEDCDPSTFGFRDGDGDGYIDQRCANDSSHGDDCDDTRADVHPALAEACDAIDNDCDGAIDEQVSAIVYTDADGDGWGTGHAQQMCAGQTGFAPQRGDCDDHKANLHPGAFRCAGSGAGIDVCGADGKWSESSCPGDGQCVPQPDGTGVCWPGSLSECADGIDNDLDGLVDASDPDCASAADVSESPERCNDGIDNDGDLYTDYPDDPGCASRFDTDEMDPATLPACADGVDNDGDGTTDYLGGTGDPGCASAADDSERDPGGAQCDDGIDNDGNTFTDYPTDPQCSSPLDDAEGLPRCMNGIDDDGDGIADYNVNAKLSDPGCTDAKDDDERGVAPNAPACDNGLDDDADGAADFPGDVGCTSPGDTLE